MSDDEQNRDLMAAFDKLFAPPTPDIPQGPLFREWYDAASAFEDARLEYVPLVRSTRNKEERDREDQAHQKFTAAMNRLAAAAAPLIDLCSNLSISATPLRKWLDSPYSGNLSLRADADHLVQDLIGRLSAQGELTVSEFAQLASIDAGVVSRDYKGKGKKLTVELARQVRKAGDGRRQKVVKAKAPTAKPCVTGNVMFRCKNPTCRHIGNSTTCDKCAGEAEPFIPR
jgi:hypothetical protein